MDYVVYVDTIGYKRRRAPSNRAAAPFWVLNDGHIQFLYYYTARKFHVEIISKIKLLSFCLFPN